ncbi:hypothetical protein [Halospeciosus flavus]|uniref:Uncharacterized protein n=2 Tax=Halospeciosus flavus TaxID=3032283 RepID=A0ABD5Z8M4_9EURY|nr:hypothetical protein [Halospeciosus flavus]
MSEKLSRRSLLKAGGVALGGGAVAAAGWTVTNGGRASASQWQVAQTPTNVTLNAAAVSAASPFAVGGGGTVLQRESGGSDSGSGSWSHVLRQGPTGNGKDLLAADATDDGKRVWFGGDAGVLAAYDVSTGKIHHHSTPSQVKSKWTGIAVRGTSGENEHVYLTTDSGQQFTGVRASPGGELQWRELKKPGSGATIPSTDFRALTDGRLADTNGKVFDTRDAGATWDAIGIEDAGADYLGMADVATDDCTVVGEQGTIYHYDGKNWRRFTVCDPDVYGVQRSGDAGLAVAGSGLVLQRSGVEKWRTVDTPTEKDLYGLAVGSKLAVAVGDGGTVVERR